MNRLTERLRYEEIAAGWGRDRVVTGYEVQLPCGTRGVGETLDEAVRAAEHARDTHRARADRLRLQAERQAERIEREHGDIPF